jgi:hypothetical protein
MPKSQRQHGLLGAGLYAREEIAGGEAWGGMVFGFSTADLPPGSVDDDSLKEFHGNAIVELQQNAAEQQAAESEEQAHAGDGQTSTTGDGQASAGDEQTSTIR